MSICIRKVNDEFNECAKVIRNSFITVANEFNITRENAPTNPAFLGSDSLMKMKEKGIEMYAAYAGGKCIGFVAIEKGNDNRFYMERLAVLPEYRHKGYGEQLVSFVIDLVKNHYGDRISIGIINENRKLKEWYKKLGFIETGIKVFDHLPFEVCFMERQCEQTVSG